MTSRHHFASVSLTALALLISLPAAADGTDTLGTTQALRADTQLGLDILAVDEAVTWTGTGALTVTDPDGVDRGLLQPGSSLVADQLGVWTFGVLSTQTLGMAWDLDVLGAAGGRVHSRSWQFNAGSFAIEAATDASFYALVPAGVSGSTAVIELRLSGLAGYVYDIGANRVGIEGAGAISTPEAGEQFIPEFPVYLTPPEIATHGGEVALLGPLEFDGGQGGASVVDGSPVECDSLRSGGPPGTFTFTADVVGTAHLRCDIDGDGSLGEAGSPDVSRAVAVEPGTNAVTWDGLDRYGNAIPAGDYSCQVEVRTGEFHYVGRDIETSYPGLRMYVLDAQGTRTPLAMTWDDTLVQDKAVVMLDGTTGRVSSPDGGLMSSPYDAVAQPNVDARSWGQFQGNGKGNQSLLDTSTWLSATSTTWIQIPVADGTEDADQDGLDDHLEACVLGSSPSDPDSDGDGVADGTQYGQTSSAYDGGLESNGSFAEALAHRRVARVRTGRSPGANRSDSGLWTWIPEVGPAGSTPVRSTPTDLIGVTEAEDVVAVDYIRDGRTVAALLLIATRGRPYSHTKPLCDRAAGRQLTDVRPSPDGTHPRATLVDPTTGMRDHAATAVAVETDGSWALHGVWLPEQVPALAADQRSVQVQAWSAVPGAQDELLEAVREHLQADWTSAGVTVDGWIQSARAEGDSIVVEGPSEVVVRGLAETGETFSLARADRLPVFTEATVEVWDGDRLVDRAWVSDGTWISLESPLLPCALAGRPDEGRPLAGCAAAVSGSVVRTLHPARPLAGSLAVVMDRPGQVCVESVGSGTFACADLNAGRNRVPFTTFTGDQAALASADLLVFRSADDGPVEVAGLALTADVEDADVVRRGCSSVTGGSLYGVVFGLLALRKR